MRNIIIYSLSIIFLLPASLYLKANDTILRKAIGNQYFYNFANNNNFDIYVGSTSGMYEIEETSLKKLNDKAGYIFYENNSLKTEVYSNTEGHFKFKNLLPKSYSVYPQQSVVKNNLIYIICNGTLFIYEVSDYTMYMKGKSIRCFTKNSIGTYDGIYCFGKRLADPEYTTGYIREYDSTFYICFDGLAIYNPKKGIKLITRPTTLETILGGIPIGFARDIIRLNDGNFIIFTTKGVYSLDDSLTILKTIFKTNDKEAPVIIDLFENPYTRNLTFSHNKTLYRYGIDSEELLEILVLKKPIVAGYKQSRNAVSEYILISDNTITYYNHGNNKLKQLSNMYQAHSAIPLGLDSVLISSQNGIYIALLNTEQLYSLYKGIEFNKRALWKGNNLIKMGTTNGYISTSKHQLLKRFSAKIKSREEQKQSRLEFWFVIIIATLLLAYIFYFQIIKRRRKYILIKNTSVVRKDIEDYIQSNLNQVTISSLKEHFKLNNRSLYEILSPHKPGNLITSKRKEKANQLIDKNFSLETISKSTGFSISYLRKIISKKNKTKNNS